MLIENIARVSGLYQPSGVSPAAKKGKAEAAKDTVMISNEAKEYAAALAAVSKTEDYRAEKVGEIEAIFRNGEYRVSAGALADSIMSYVG